MIGRMPRLFTISTAINHAVWRSCAARQSANPFHTTSQIAAVNRIAAKGMLELVARAKLFSIVIESSLSA